MKLLLVEDDTKTVQLVQKGLTSEGYVVDIAMTGEDGLHLASGGRKSKISVATSAPPRPRKKFPSIIPAKLA